jgi:hypothetical protein
VSAIGPIASKVLVKRATSFSENSEGRPVPSGEPRLVASGKPRGALLDLAVLTNLPNRLPPSRDEIAIWRAFLSEEIAAIMRDNE